MNVGLINVSDNNKTLLGIGEILSGITVVILLWIILKWCFNVTAEEPSNVREPWRK